MPFDLYINYFVIYHELTKGWGAKLGFQPPKGPAVVKGGAVCLVLVAN